MRITDHDLTHAFGLAYSSASKSPDPSTQVGACLLTPCLHSDGHSCCSAHNSPVPHLAESEAWVPERRRLLTTHAEEAAILVAAKYGRQTQGSIMCAPWACCEKCASIIIRAGVSQLFVHDEAMARDSSRWGDEIRRAHALLRLNGVEINVWTAPPDFKRPTLRYMGADW